MHKAMVRPTLPRRLLCDFFVFAAFVLLIASRRWLAVSVLVSLGCQRPPSLGCCCPWSPPPSLRGGGSQPLSQSTKGGGLLPPGFFSFSFCFKIRTNGQRFSPCFGGGGRRLILFFLPLEVANANFVGGLSPLSLFVLRNCDLKGNDPALGFGHLAQVATGGGRLLWANALR